MLGPINGGQFALALLVFSSPLFTNGTKVGQLTGHDPTEWSQSALDDCLAGSTNPDAGSVVCNLKIYESAIQAAAQEGIELMVFPEAYGLAGNNVSFFEPLADIGTNPCHDMAPNDDDWSEIGTLYIQQNTLSCAAEESGVAIAANIFTYVWDDYDFETQSATMHRYITEVVMDKTGTVVSYYHKHWLFPSETMVEPGPFAPTVFDMFGKKWGIVICWEGFRADIEDDWSQYDGLVEQGATSLVWSIGFGAPKFPAKLDTQKTAIAVAKKYGVAVVSSVDTKFHIKGDAGFIDASGGVISTSEAVLTGLPGEYTAKPAVHFADL